MKIRIHVTKDVLRQSMYCPLARVAVAADEFDTIKNNCAVAVAIRDLFPNALVYQSCVHLQGDLESRVNFDNQTMFYVKDFDEVFDYRERLDMPEYSFDIEVPQYIIDGIGIAEVDKILSESKTLERV